MSFRCRQKLVIPSSCTVMAVDYETLKSGDVVARLVDQGEVTMPPPELFDLEAQQEAGVKIEEVNSKVLGSARIDADKVIKKFTKKSNKQTNKEK